MPVITPSSYRPPMGFNNPHVQIFWSSLFRAVPLVDHRREMISTSDGDELQLDWVSRVQPGCPLSSPPGTPIRTLLILHGLESHARLRYISGTALAFLRNGWEVAALNFRDCGDTPNRLWQSYHSGVSQDVATVVAHLLRRRPDRRLGLIGYSLGGNVLLKYLGSEPDRIPAEVAAAVAISAPVDVASAVTQLSEPFNSFYNWRFLNRLRWKLRRRCERFPGMLDEGMIPHLRTFQDFDDVYTAPAHGFGSAREYWERASSLPHLERLRVPTLLINALDDPFLGPSCYPVEAAENNGNLHLETPRHGGHIGFIQFNSLNREYWHEVRAREFLETRLPDPNKALLLP